MTQHTPAPAGPSADELHDPLLRWVLTRGMVLGLLVVGGFAATGDVGLIAGAALGVIIGLGNFWLMRRLMWRVLSRPGRGRALAMGALLFKLGALGAIIFLSMTYLPINPIALLCGLSVVVVMIMASALLGPTPAEDEAEDGDEGVA